MSRKSHTDIEPEFAKLIVGRLGGTTILFELGVASIELEVVRAWAFLMASRLEVREESSLKDCETWRANSLEAASERRVSGPLGEAES